MHTRTRRCRGRTRLVLGPIETKAASVSNSRGFNSDPCGSFLFAAAIDSASISGHAIDANTGDLDHVKRYLIGRQPNWIEIVDRIDA